MRHSLLFMQTRPGISLYHYGWYEQDVWQMAERYGAPEGFARRACERSVDVLERLREAIISTVVLLLKTSRSSLLGGMTTHRIEPVLWYEEWTTEIAICSTMFAVTKTTCAPMGGGRRARQHAV